MYVLELLCISVEVNGESVRVEKVGGVLGDLFQRGQDLRRCVLGQ